MKSRLTQVKKHKTNEGKSAKPDIHTARKARATSNFGPSSVSSPESRLARIQSGGLYSLVQHHHAAGISREHQDYFRTAVNVETRVN